ncbi:transmembrane and coiled-coil domain-containing protein 4-like isoform X1 [Salvia splendens]|uniref:transmembrane and coiled-coil domain-containing protein 4-like isoform X1 n=2 Tax=Salvia splendens TaxID=180675 RepID=UPI001C2665ED|nr:transmembrane and coiled-coil domain-containing protein 4-like isoform X1 [Salvia splendens]
MSSSSKSMLTPPQKHSASALFAMALNQAQIHQTQPLGLPASADDGSPSEDPQLWGNRSSALLQPVFQFFEIDSKSWGGVEESAGSSPAKNHLGAFLRLLAEESGNVPSEVAKNGTALVDAVDAMSSKLDLSPADHDSKKQRQLKYEYTCREKFSAPEETQESKPEERDPSDVSQLEKDVATSKSEQAVRTNIIESDGRPMEEAEMVSYQTKILVLYELLSACLADLPEDNEKSAKRRKGYDSRHRVALRLLATWFDVKWIKMEAIEIMVACTAMAILKQEESKEEGNSTGTSWEKWKRGGIIGAAALTGGTLMAITGGLAAPAIAAGFGALAPTLGTIIPVIGAGGFAAVATAAGSVAGSVAVAASFGAAGAGLTGTKVARRIGDVEEFEFKTIGDNHNQGRLAVEILISGFVFEEEDFLSPWEAQHENLERYALQWESEHLIAVSTAIQDWLTSKIAMELMKQGAMMTVLSTLMTALAWPAALLSLTSFIDSKWAIAIDRSDKAGKMLAEVLLKGLQGHRPVTLVGFSLGARVILSCLETLAESETNAGLVERVVLLGAPIAIKDTNWEATRKMVAGRYINVYSTNDWMLGMAFRANLLTRGLAGILPVDVPGIENVDATEFIDGHSSYLWRTQQILEQLELDTYYPVFNREAVKP